MPLPFRNIELIKQVVSFKKKGLSERQIAKLLPLTENGKPQHHRAVTRYWKYAKEMGLVKVADKLSTRKQA